MTPFIISRCTASEVLKRLKSAGKGGEARSPTDFNSTFTRFQIQGGRVFFESRSPALPRLSIEIPVRVFEECFQRNLAYRISMERRSAAGEPAETVAQHAAPGEWIPPRLEVTLEGESGPWIALLDPLVLRAKADGKVFKLSEPELERGMLGPILEMEGMKMHLTQGFSSAFEFSGLLASSAGVKPAHDVLDLFFGMGYSAKEAIRLGARRVFTFEKYPEVIELARRNPFAVDLQAPQLRLHPEPLDLEKDAKRFFQALEEAAVLFDAVILDPPRRQVMLKVYSRPFLRELSAFVKKGARVSAYVPGGTSRRFKVVLGKAAEVFEETGEFRFARRSPRSEFICVFQKT
ncbi:MAG: RsmD family RNA methyltransferase [Planctomycetes bacterium]|nr:RsmD family RNA methyltransferase [Planctomycetota bacterium]